MRRLVLSVGIALGLACRCAALAASYDVTADWSDAANPNGVWTCREGTNALGHIASWEDGTGNFTMAQPGWARSENLTDRIPFWFKSVGAENFVHDWQGGDVVVHSRDDANGIGTGDGNVIWTSPDEGLVTIAGSVWMGREIARSNHWALYKNDVLLTGGDIASGDAFSRAMPFDLAAGSGGSSAVTDVGILIGDIIRLALTKTSTFGDFAGVDLRLTTGTSTTTTTSSSTSTSTSTTTTSSTSTTTSSTTSSSTTTSTSTTTAPPTTTTTLPAGPCEGVPSGPSFISIDCRLTALLARVNGEGGLGNFQAKLAHTLEKTTSRLEEGASLCGAPDLKKSRQRLKQTIRGMIQYAHRLNGLAARKKLDATLRESLLADGDPIAAHLKTLRTRVRCPDDAPPG